MPAVLPALCPRDPLQQRLEARFEIVAEQGIAVIREGAVQGIALGRFQGLLGGRQYLPLLQADMPALRRHVDFGRFLQRFCPRFEDILFQCGTLRLGANY